MEELLNSKVFRALVGFVGLATAGLSFMLVTMGIVELVRGSPDPGPAIGVSVCMLFSGTFGAALTWYGYRGVFGDSKPGDAAEARVLTVAEENDGRVTVAMIAAGSDLSMTEGEQILNRLTSKGLIRMDVDPNGNNVYVFPGLGDSDEETTFDEQQFQEELAAARRAAGSDS